MRLFFRYLRGRAGTILYILLCAALLVSAFALYDLPLQAVLYPLVLCAVLGLIFMFFDCRRVMNAHRCLSAMAEFGLELSRDLPEDHAILSGDYQTIIRLLETQQAKLAGDQLQKYNAMIDYYTVWAHQIKTPIAAMRLTLQNEDSALSRRLRQELSRVERYVDMVMTFVRLGADSTDYVIREYELDGLIRPAVRKFSSEFIDKRLSLDYQAVHQAVLTDEKWLSFVIEQLLSNAVKYTEKGKIAIYFAQPDTLCIRDTGIGIAREDLPRIFENGYTGFNGRTDMRASGIGLYLCKRVCDRLGHEIRVESRVGQGTTVSIRFGARIVDIRE